MPALTRGPHPARVYWFRRLFVLGSAVLLVVAIARVLGGSSDASDGATAELSADTPSSSTTASASTTATPSATPTGTARPTQQATSEAPVLAAPTGTCRGDDVAVTPKVGTAVAGRDVMIVLQLRTMTAEACTWRISSSALAVNITSGQDAIWNSRDCPRAIPRRDVVVRQDITTTVGVVWHQAKRSDDDCSAQTGWAMPGWYHVTAAALGGEPSDVQFELTTPVAGTVTVTASPKQSPSSTASNKPGSKASSKPGRTPSGSASGAVEPDATTD